MHEIFISYRRIDTGDSAIRLYDDLCASFGPQAVFMDKHPGDIPWGADWEQELASALQGCDALIALIGPKWTSCERSPGCRRLDAPDDWVRREIATVLKKDGAFVMPLVFDGAHIPAPDDLPRQLVDLRFDKCQGNFDSITAHSWKTEVARLVRRLAERPLLKPLHDLATAKTGIRLLEDLIRSNPSVARAVWDSRSAIDDTGREIAELKFMKELHDALHTIEAECLETLRIDASAARLVSASFNFATQRSAICAAVDAHKPLDASLAPVAAADHLIDPTLTALRARLDIIEVMFAAALHPGGAAGREAVVAELARLIAYFPDKLHGLISGAAARLRLGRLMRLVAKVRGVLPDMAAQDPELRPLLEVIGALDGLRKRLNRLVKEHGLLQVLDFTLRQACEVTGTAGASAGGQRLVLELEWGEIETRRAQLAAPFSPELEQAGIGRLEALESQVRAAVAGGDGPAAVDLIGAYFQAVGAVFRALDASLKKFCDELDITAKPLRTILSQVEEPHA